MRRPGALDVSVLPPEVEKKKAVMGAPLYVAITPAVACTAAVLCGCSPPEPSKPS